MVFALGLSLKTWWGAGPEDVKWVVCVWINFGNSSWSHLGATFGLNCKKRWWKGRKKKEKNVEKRCNRRTFHIQVLLSLKHAWLRSSDGIRCISAGMIAPVKYCTINVYMGFALGLSLKTWWGAGPGDVKWVVCVRINFGNSSLSHLGGTIGFNCKKRWWKWRKKKEKNVKKRCNTRTSQEVTHPSTTLAQARLTAEF